MINKLVTKEQAVANISNGFHLMIGGFLTGGTPNSVVNEVIRQNKKDLTITATDVGKEGCGIFDLIKYKHAKELNASYIGSNPYAGEYMIDGSLKVNLFPQGSLAEKIRAGGAGLGGVLTPVGLDTIVEEGKEKIEVQGKPYLLELPLKANVAIIKANVADRFGNLLINGTSRNFNTVMAFAADFVIVEVEEYWDEEIINPNNVVIPGVLVDAIVKES